MNLDIKGFRNYSVLATDKWMPEGVRLQYLTSFLSFQNFISCVFVVELTAISVFVWVRQVL
jgi:hypothetical protein